MIALILAAQAATTSSLSWVRLDGAETCLAAPELARTVEEQLGRPVFVPPSGADVAIEGRAERTEGGWRAVLRLTDPGGAVLGDRAVESRAATCDELGRVVATTLALMIDPGEEEAVAPDPVAEETIPDSRWTFAFESALTLGGGAVPGVGIGGIGMFRVVPPRLFSALAHGEILPFSRVGVDGGYTDLARMMGGVQVCPLRLGKPDIRALNLDGCLGVDAGVIFVVSSTVDLAEQEKVLAQAHGALHLRVRVVGPLLVRAGLHAIVPFRAVSFVRADDASVVVYAPTVVAGYGDLGLGVAF